MKALRAVHSFIFGLHLLYLRRRILNKQLEGLADPTLLDRMVAGENK